MRGFWAFGVGLGIERVGEGGVVGREEGKAGRWTTAVATGADAKTFMASRSAAIRAPRLA